MAEEDAVRAAKRELRPGRDGNLARRRDLVLLPPDVEGLVNRNVRKPLRRRYTPAGGGRPESVRRVELLCTRVLAVERTAARRSVVRRRAGTSAASAGQAVLSRRRVACASARAARSLLVRASEAASRRARMTGCEARRRRRVEIVLVTSAAYHRRQVSLLSTRKALAVRWRSARRVNRRLMEERHAMARQVASAAMRRRQRAGGAGNAGGLAFANHAAKLAFNSRRLPRRQQSACTVAIAVMRRSAEDWSCCAFARTRTAVVAMAIWQRTASRLELSRQNHHTPSRAPFFHFYCF